MIQIAARITGLARRLGAHAWATLLVSSLLTVASVVIINRGLSFNSDLTDLLPPDHPDLVTLREIEATYPTDTGFMVLLSRNYHFAVDAQGRAMVHDGRVWHRHQTGGALHAVFGFSPTEVFAAGAGGRVHRYDGKRWNPSAPAGKVTIRDLWGRSPQTMLAVGDGGAIQRFDGKAWHVEAAPTRATLRALWGNPGGVVYAVGDRGTVLRRIGRGRWRREALPRSVCGEAGCERLILRGVWVADSGEVYVVGDGGLLLVRAPAVVADEASKRAARPARWRRQPTGTDQRLSAVWGVGADYVVAVGDAGTRLRYDGERVVAEPAKVHQGADLLAVHGVARDVAWAAGDRCAYLRRTRELDFWWHEPLDTVDPGGAWPPAAFVADRAACDSRYTAIWRPPNDMSRVEAFVPKLAALLEESPGVGRVEYRKPVRFFKDRALYYLPVKDLQRLYQELKETLDRETAKASGLFVDLDEDEGEVQGKQDPAKKKLEDLFARYGKQARQLGRSDLYQHYDEASIGVVVFPKRGAGNLANLRRLRGELQRVIDSTDYRRKVDPLMRIDIGGDGVSKIREYEETINDITGLAWLAIVGIVLILAAYFRRLVGLLFVLVPLSMSITWTFALTTLTIGTLNTVTGFLFAVLFGLGIDYGLQMYGRYREERLAGADVDQAMDATVLETGRATVTSATTTSAALLTLMVADFRGFSEFGFIAGVGAILSLAAFLLVLPAQIHLAERLGLLRLRAATTAGGEGNPARRREAPLRWPRLVLALSLAGAAYGVFGAVNVQFEYDHRVLRSVGKPNEILSRSNHCFGGSMTPTIFLAGSRDELRAALDGLQRSRERLIAAGETSPVRKTSSILAVVPDRQPEKKQLLRRAAKLLHSKRWNLVSEDLKRKIQLGQLRRMSLAAPFGLAELPPAVRRAFHGPGFGDAWIGQAYYGGNISDSRQARRLKQQIGNFPGSPWLSLGRLLPAGAKVWIEGQRVEVRCAADTREVCRERLTGLEHQGQPALVKVVDTAQAYDEGLAVEGGLRGDLLAIAAKGLVPVKRRLDRVIAPSGRFKASSGELVLTEVVEVMLGDARLAMALALAAVFVFCLIDFRSLRLAALACAPLGFGLLWIFALLHAMSLKLNMFNFVVLPALVGIGIDYGVHYVHRQKEDGGVPVAQVRGALYWVLLFCAATSVIGFGNMALASHPGLRSLGELAIIGLACMFVASNYTLPALLDLHQRRRR